MRAAIALTPDPLGGLPALKRSATALEASGIGIAWFEQGPADPAPFCSAALLAASTRYLRLAVAVAAGAHPVAIAEDAAVLDAASNGRAVLALHGEDGELLRESAEAVQAALRPLPFEHRGARWQIPARLDSNGDHEQRLRVTPATTQAQLPLFLTGPAAPALAAELRLPLAEVLDLSEPGLGWPDPGRLTAELLARRQRRGLELAVLRPPAAASEREVHAAAALFASRVQPRIELDRLPEGLEEHWQATLERGR